MRLDVAFAIVRTTVTLAETMSDEQCREAAAKLRALDANESARLVYGHQAAVLEKFVTRRAEETSGASAARRPADLPPFR